MQYAIHDWDSWARAEQIQPQGDWNIWLILSGRGWGKTRTGAETIIQWAKDMPGCRLHLVARTAGDVRDTMVEGESGILNISHPDFRPEWKPSTRKLEWPNGTIATTFSAEEPDQLRGPQCHAFWADELASWKYPDAWDQLQFGCRLGTRTRGIVTTTPRPVKVIKDLLARDDVHITRGSTFDNSDNLSPAALAALEQQYGGTRLGRQELHGEVLDDNPLALWKRTTIDSTRVMRIPNDVTLTQIVVGIDPSISSTGDECGIIVAAQGTDQDYYVLDDLSIQGAPAVWAKAANTAFHRHRCNWIIYEANQGGEMVEQTLRLYDSVPTRSVWASRGKYTRAEPISLLAEQGRIHHVGSFAALEDELCEWTPGDKSPNRLDAFVWAVTWLRENTNQPQSRVKVYSSR